MKRFVLTSIVLVSFLIFSFYYRVIDRLTLSAVIPTTAPESQTAQSFTINDSPTPIPTSPSGYKNGTFIGDIADAFYGNIQVQVVMQSGSIADVRFLQYPSDRSRSIEINQYAMPILKSEAIQAQSANVDIVSGATDSSRAFIQSLQSALNKAKG